MRPSKIDAAAWEEIKIQYERGDNARLIAEKYKIARSTIAMHAKQYGWTHPTSSLPRVAKEIKIPALPKTKPRTLREIKALVTETKQNAVVDVVKDMLSTVAHSTINQMPLAAKQLKALSEAHESAVQALELHFLITQLTKMKLQNGEYEPHHAAAVLKAQGYDVVGALRTLGISDTGQEGINVPLSEAAERAVRIYLPEKDPLPT